MSYKDIDSEDIIKDISSRKEFFSLKIDNRNKFNIAGSIKNQQIKQHSSDIIPRFILDREIKKGNFLQLHPYQLFVSNFINPNTPYKRLLVKWETGTGKTIAALTLAKSFIDYYRKESERGSPEIGTVFILGFNQGIFKKELITYPEFGFITREEIKKLNQLKKVAARGTKTELANLQEFIIKIKKRFSNRKRNGFFKFYGYREFVNRIFLPRDPDININNMTEEEVLLSLKKNKIKFNEELLESFKNSLIICDEIHNVYNSIDKNNWGIAIQSVLDNIPTVRAVYLSATPLNNSPTEIVDLLNLLIPDQKFKKDDFFSNAKTGDLKPNTLNKIKDLIKGRISFIRDTNPEFFPSRTYLGEYISDIPHLKFTRCPMSSFHYKTYKKIYDNTPTQDIQYLVDFILPNPQDKEFGIYQTKQIKSIIKNAPQTWKDKVGFDMDGDIIVGDALNKKTLQKYSSKYFHMIERVHEIIKKKMGKIFIYHNIVHMSGVLFIQEVLRNNGIIGEFDAHTDATLCVLCGRTYGNHSAKDKEKFVPVRFIVAHSEINKPKILRSIDKYNQPDNSDGRNLLILVGSKLIKESYDIKTIQNILIMGRPDNIPALVQITGRAARKNSHIYLPIDKHNVNIQIFTTALPIKNKKGEYEKSHEELKYKDKIKDYDVMRMLEKAMHESAVDAAININIMFNEKCVFNNVDPLGPIPYRPDYIISKEFKSKNTINSTSDVFYEEEEVKYIVYIIKRLFIEQDSVWTYEQIFDAIRNPPHNWYINKNTKLVEESTIQIALTKLLWVDKCDKCINKIMYTEPITEKLNMDKLMEDDIYEVVIETMFDSDEKILILPNGQKCMIVQIGKYYTLMPLDTSKHKIQPIIDIELPYRVIRKFDNKNISIRKYLENISSKLNYQQKKIKYKKKYQHLELNQMEDAVCDYGADFHQLFIEDTIEYILNFLIGKCKNTSEYHDFYFKMLYYYDIIGIILWASTVKENIREKYKPYIQEPVNHMKEKEKNTQDILKILESNLSKTACNWCPEIVQKKYYSSVTKSIELSKKKIKKGVKIPANMLPVGHFIKETPRIYDVTLSNSMWKDIPSYVSKSTISWEENDIIIGFDEKSAAGVHVRFKLRSPIQDIKKFKDIRRIEKGSICASKSKTYLLEVANKLGIKKIDRVNVLELCDSIRTKLINNEIRERKLKNSKIKWFYGYYERQPII